MLSQVANCVNPHGETDIIKLQFKREFLVSVYKHLRKQNTTEPAKKFPLTSCTKDARWESMANKLIATVFCFFFGIPFN